MNRVGASHYVSVCYLRLKLLVRYVEQLELSSFKCCIADALARFATVRGTSSLSGTTHGHWLRGGSWTWHRLGLLHVPFC
jgi:hypothetical protein